MKIVKTDESGLKAAADALTGGGIVVVPTDTVYGLAAHPDFPEAVARLAAIKRRDAGKPIALLASDAVGAAKFLGGMDGQAERIAARHWPGALTMVLPVWEDGTETCRFEGLRVPDHEWTRNLIRLCGGVLRVTSANLAGAKAATDAAATLSGVGIMADVVVDGGTSPGGEASTVAKVCGGEIEILREGPVAFLTLASASPRRAKILRGLDVDFTVVKTDAPEVSHPDDPERTVRENALAKGAAARAMGKKHVLSADTIVWFGGRIYSKPGNLAEAAEFLRELGGNTHSVFTGVAYDGEVKVVRSDVTFRRLSEDDIAAYVERVKPLDRAGAYDIDVSGDLIVESYTGSYENIMGLPVEPLAEWGIAKGKADGTSSQRN